MDPPESLMDRSSIVQTLSSESAVDLASSLLHQVLDLSVETESLRLERTVMEVLAAMELLANSSMDKLYADPLLDLVMCPNFALETTTLALQTNSNQQLLPVESSLECVMSN